MARLRFKVQAEYSHLTRDRVKRTRSSVFNAMPVQPYPLSRVFLSILIFSKIHRSAFYVSDAVAFRPCDRSVMFSVQLIIHGELQNRSKSFFFSIIAPRHHIAKSPAGSQHFCVKCRYLFCGHFDVATVRVHAHACLFVALAFSAFFYVRTFVPGRRALHTSECLFFTRSSTLKVSGSFGLAAHVCPGDTPLFAFQFLFDRECPRCSVVRSWDNFY